MSITILLTVCFLFGIKCILCFKTAINVYNPQKFPFLAQLFIPLHGYPMNVGQTCVGTLIHPLWILTAAHCFPNTTTERRWLIQQQRQMVFMGSVLSFNYEKSIPNTFVEIICHPKYSWFKKQGTYAIQNDIAIGKLKHSYKVTTTVTTITLMRHFRHCSYVMWIGVGWPTEDGEDYEKYIQYTYKIIKYPKIMDLETKTKIVTELSLKNDIRQSYPGEAGEPLICYINSNPVQSGVLSAMYYENRTKTVKYLFERVELAFNFIKSHIPDIYRKRPRKMMREGTWKQPDQLVASIGNKNHGYILFSSCVAFSMELLQKSLV